MNVSFQGCDTAAGYRPGLGESVKPLVGGLTGVGGSVKAVTGLGESVKHAFRLVVGFAEPRGYKDSMSTRFPQLDELDVQVVALREMRKPALRYLLTEAAGALYLAARVALPALPQMNHHRVIREYGDRPGYWSERVYTHAEVRRDLAQAWATSVKQPARATESLERTGD